MRILIYIVVSSVSADALDRLRAAVGRPWLERYVPRGAMDGEVRYWVPPDEDPEAERATLALAGFKSSIEVLDGRNLKLVP